MGTRLGKLKPVDGFAAETSAAIVIGAASQFGFPLSTTPVISSSILGVGATRQPGNVHWAVAGNIITAWIITIPLCAFLAYLCYLPLALAGRIGCLPRRREGKLARAHQLAVSVTI